MDIEKLEKLMKIIKNSKHLVFFGGAGVSTASNIPDFRGEHGLYNYTPEDIISHSFFKEHTKEFYEFYFDKMVYLDALPNDAHKYFAELEKEGKVSSVITQNIDNLHQLAGSKNVIEIHGTIMKNHCMKCNKYYDLKDILNKEIPPRCDCGGLIKPDVVLYEEGLNEDDINKALEEISTCDMLIIVGTSLVVYPAAGFVRYFRGKYLVLLNKSETSYDSNCDIVIHDDVCKVVNELKK